MIGQVISQLASALVPVIQQVMDFVSQLVTAITPLIQQLVDDRILHIIKRGWSGKDNPGERYDVLQIDYGCYVHLLGTNAAPQSLLGGDDDEEEFSAVIGDVEVPEDDYRAIRRAILDLPTLLAVISPPRRALQPSG